jgi:hypothetical protein
VTTFGEMASEVGGSSQMPQSSSSRRFSEHTVVDCDTADSPPDRLPTVSASDTLHKLRNATPHVISTGLPRLDAILSGQRAGVPSSTAASRGRGLARGQITEVYGPPGVGKTTLWYVYV